VSWYFKVPIAIAAGWYIFKMGRAMIGGLARPIPAPPPDGELRRVNMRYRCPSCGTEIRMVKTDVTDPIPPRHCMDEMDLIQVDGEAVEAEPGNDAADADSDTDSDADTVPSTPAAEND
jgi:hypothetical protein